jgi:hypothetical protein
MLTTTRVLRVSIPCDRAQGYSDHVLHQWEHVNDPRPARGHQPPETNDDGLLILTQDRKLASEQSHPDQHPRHHSPETRHANLLFCGAPSLIAGQGLLPVGFQL